MDSQTRSQYQSLLQEDWIKLGYQSDDSGLTGEIHPLFQRTNASRPFGAEHIWPQFKSEGEYGTLCAELGTVFQIASNMLETPASLDFLYQVAYSPRITSRQGLSKRGRPCKEFGWSEPPPVTGRQMAKMALRRLSHSLTFMIGDSNVNPEVEDSFAVTIPTLTGFSKGVKMNEASSLMGSAGRIIVNEDYLLMLRDLDIQKENTTSQRMSLQVKMAITLCHEISHALAIAVDRELFKLTMDELEAAGQAYNNRTNYQVHGSRVDEPFYKDETVAEIGNSWENQVFGGKIIWSAKVNDPLFVNEWPSFFTSDGDHPTRGTENSTSQKHVVSMHFLRNLYRQRFWDSVRAEHTNALYVKKTIGIEYPNPDLQVVSIDPSHTLWPRDQNSNRVSRERNGQPVPDPSDSGANQTEKERMRIV